MSFWNEKRGSSALPLTPRVDGRVSSGGDHPETSPAERRADFLQTLKTALKKEEEIDPANVFVAEVVFSDYSRSDFELWKLKPFPVICVCPSEKRVRDGQITADIRTSYSYGVLPNFLRLRFSLIEGRSRPLLFHLPPLLHFADSSRCYLGDLPFDHNSRVEILGYDFQLGFSPPGTQYLMVVEAGSRESIYEDTTLRVAPLVLRNKNWRNDLFQADGSMKCPEEKPKTKKKKDFYLDVEELKFRDLMRQDARAGFVEVLKRVGVFPEYSGLATTVERGTRVACLETGGGRKEVRILPKAEIHIVNFTLLDVSLKQVLVWMASDSCRIADIYGGAFSNRQSCLDRLEVSAGITLLQEIRVEASMKKWTGASFEEEKMDLGAIENLPFLIRLLSDLKKPETLPTFSGFSRFEEDRKTPRYRDPATNHSRGRMNPGQTAAMIDSLQAKLDGVRSQSAIVLAAIAAEKADRSSSSQPGVRQEVSGKTPKKEKNRQLTKKMRSAGSKAEKKDNKLKGRRG